jgi:signal recognition particle GTPase
MKYNINFDIELKKNPYRGTYIALEGIDGSGKTTQVEKLAA